MPLHTSRPGVLILDVLIGTAVFSIIVSGVIYALLFAQQSSLKSGDQIRAVYLNQQNLIGIKSIRDNDFASITAGTHGVRLGEDGLWELSGTGTVSTDGFHSHIDVAAVDDNTFRVTTTTTWSVEGLSSGTSTLVTSITDWHREQAASNWANIALDGAYIDDGTPLFNDAAVVDDYVFVTSEVSDGGAGLYLFNISDTGNPVREAESVALSEAGYEALVVGDYLYVVTGESDSEVHIYDVSDPSSFTGGDLVASINIPGEGKARALTYVNDTLYVASLEDSSEDEFFAYDVSDLGSISLQDSLDDESASFHSVVLHNAYAYLSSSSDTMELRVIDAFDPEDLQFAPGGGGYNIPDTPNAMTIAAFSDYLLVGRVQGDVTEELHLFDVSESPVPTAAPFNAEAGANVNSVDSEPTGTYAFAATEHDSQELLVLDIDNFAGGGNPIVDVWDTSTGLGRGVYYSSTHDRVFLMTNTAVVILQAP